MLASTLGFGYFVLRWPKALTCGNQGSYADSVFCRKSVGRAVYCC
jgi:hypothetical protein